MKFTQSETQDGVLIIELDGRMDIAGVEEIDAKLSEAAASSKSIVIDMCRVDYMASLGIRKLLQTAKAVAHNGKKLSLVSPQSLVLGVLKVANIDSIIAIMPSIDAAIRFVK